MAFPKKVLKSKLSSLNERNLFCKKKENVEKEKNNKSAH